MSKPAVEFDNVSIVFGDRPESALPAMDRGLSRAEVQAETGQVLGVHNCSLTVEEGEILVLMGLSGSGKSTLLRAVNGLNPVARGSVTVRADDWSCTLPDASPSELRHLRRECVSMVFQQFGLLPWRRVRENVGLGLELDGMPADKRREAVDLQLDLVGLTDWADHRVGELSGGMQQRVGLADHPMRHTRRHLYQSGERIRGRFCCPHEPAGRVDRRRRDDSGRGRTG